MITGGNAMEKIGVIGAGSWGTALSQTLACKGYEVHIYDVNKEHLDEMFFIHIVDIDRKSVV